MTNTPSPSVELITILSQVGTLPLFKMSVLAVCLLRIIRVFNYGA